MHAVRVAALLVLALTVAADDVARSRALQNEAQAALQSGDRAAYLTKIRAASDLRPQHPTLLMRVGMALVLNGRNDDALAVFERVASMGFVYVLDDPELHALRELPRFRAVQERFAANGRAVGSARTELTIDRLGLIPEGMAYDEKTRRFFVSSVRTGTIFAVDRHGRATELVTDAPWGVFGMAADPKRRLLWATTTAMPQVEGFDKAKGGTALLRIDLDTGRILDTLRTAEAQHFGDVALAANGDVYLTDSRAPVIYRVSGATFEPFLRGAFTSLQGLAVSDGVLYVADYSQGLAAVDLVTRDVHFLRVPPDASLLGIDGLYRADDRTLIATQNGTNPNRIIRIRLTPGGLAVASVETLAANLAGMGDPTLGVIAGGRFHFNANAQWDLFGDDGTIRDPVKLAPAVVLSVDAR